MSTFAEAEARARAIPVPTYGQRWRYRMGGYPHHYGGQRVSAKRYNFYLPHAELWARVWAERRAKHDLKGRNEEIRRARKSGLSCRVIAEQWGISRNRAHHIASTADDDELKRQDMARAARARVTAEIYARWCQHRVGELDYGRRAPSGQ